ncbi:uncharacterized protein LOC143274989 [Babylonia areolata]|uniref:uncharacterized protein LOC143274989 n=1 Tax=Babylonia areolata TaxID=304850 RepID=UPI003FD2ADBA
MSTTRDTIFLLRSTWHSLDNTTRSDLRNVTAGFSDSTGSEIAKLLWRTIPVIFLVFGTFGNMMTVVVMRGMRSSQSTACLSLYFTALAVSDQFELLTSTIFFLAHKGFSWPPSYFKLSLSCSVPYFVWNMSAITSAWFLVAMTYQRVISVIAPHRVGILCTMRRGKIIVAIITFLSFAMNVQVFFTWTYRPDYGECYYRPEYFEAVKVYFNFQVWAFYSILPFLFLVIGNSILIWQVIKSSQISLKMRGKVDQQSTSKSGKIHSMSVTLIVISVVYLVFTLPDCIYDTFFEAQHYEISDGMSELVKTIVTLGWIFVTASNFYLYLLSGRKFRQETKRYLFCQDTDRAK